jgi:endoglucanase
MLGLKVVPFVLFLAIEMPFAQTQTNPVKMATQARFDLTSASVPLDRVEVLAGSGKVERPNWGSAEAKSRSYTANFAVSHYAWSEIKVRFLPQADGPVELKLMGPWEEASKGVLYREEVLWDRLEIPGTATVRPGDFVAPEPGNSNGAGSPEPSSARTWHNAPVSLKFPATNNVPVTLTLFAKAAIPKNFKEMRRLDKSSRAFIAAKSFLHGANLGNYLEAPPGQDWGMKYSGDDFVRIKEEGFDHVRIPVGWHNYAGAGPEFALKSEIFAKVDFLVTNALARGLNAIVNIHHFDAFTSEPVQQKQKFYGLWKQIAAHYADAPVGVAFELINEPKDKATTAVLNPIYAETIRLIRKSNPTRTIFLGPGKWNSIDELPLLQLPDDDDNLIVTVHCYDPFYFTHQGASWAGPDVKTKGIVFPGPPKTPLVPDPALNLKSGVLDWIHAYNTNPTETNPSSARAFRPKLQRAKDWSDYYGRPIHLGEFGAYIAADPDSRANFYRQFRRALDQLQLGWAIWDWKAGFKYWDGAKNQPAPGMREALFDRAAN